MAAAPRKRGATARFRFEPVLEPVGLDDLTPLLRRQLAADTELSLGYPTKPNRLPKRLFAIKGYVRLWRVYEEAAHVFDFWQSGSGGALFFPDSDEPVGVERIQHDFAATGRRARRGLELDLRTLAWELNRDWSGKRLAPLDETPAPGVKLKPVAFHYVGKWPDDEEFV